MITREEIEQKITSNLAYTWPTSNVTIYSGGYSFS
jgi:hypothetical protein